MLTIGSEPARAGTTLGGRVSHHEVPVVGRRARPVAVNAAVVAVLTLLALASLTVLDAGSAVHREPDAPAVLLVLAAAAVTLGRHRWPVPAAVGSGVLVGAYLVLGYPYTVVFGFVVLGVYGVARHRPTAVSGGVAGTVYLLLVVHVLTNDAALDGVAGLLPGLAWVAIPFTAGVARRAVVTAQSRERTAADRRLVDAERLRLSQEVHDVVGHGLAAIQMQADVTLHLSAPRPEQTRAALEAISEASRSALEEMRGALAREGGVGPRAPTPGLAGAERLCGRVRDSGVTVRYTVSGDPVPLPTAADVAAYRVLQESLTNVLTHSANPQADVRVVHDARAVTVEITNPHPAPDAVDGIGITGMRRRIAQVGGAFRAGPGAQPGTFQVRAVVPRVREGSR